MAAATIDKPLSVAEEIIEPLEEVWRQLVKLSNESAGVPLNPEYTKNKIFVLAQEMDVALSIVRRELEGLLEPDEYGYHDESRR
jgi:hypothetical protein